MRHRIGLRVLAALLLTLTLAITPGSFGIPPFLDGTGWLNSRPLDPRDLNGKVVLVDFWEYTCINCLRTLPYLKTWYDRYHNDGLVIVGVHTPEFGFSGDEKNVEAATRRLGVQWPVVLDTNREIWNRYNNAGWPYEYLFDQSGRLVDIVAGEGGYQETESKIQGLLKAGNSKLALPPVMALLPQDSYAKPGAICYLHTPEILLQRATIANAVKSNNRRHDSTYTDTVGTHTDGAIYLQGLWHMTDEAAVPGGAPGYLAMRYHAIQVVSVLAPQSGKGVRVDLTQDGAPIAKRDAGADIHYDAAGKSYVMVDASRAYELVMNAKMAFHDLRLTPESSGVGVYSFDFESCEATT